MRASTLAGAPGGSAAGAPGYEACDPALAAHSRFMHDAVDQWLDDPGITIVCGRWSEGAIAEFIPEGRGKLLPEAYGGCFSGVRELRLAGEAHHLHLDFGRIHRLRYAVAPSVCLRFKPSFEVRLLLLGPGGAPTDQWMVSLMLTQPYAGGALDRSSVARYLRRARLHAAARPGLVEIDVDERVRAGAFGEEILAVLRETAGLPRAAWDEAIRALVPPVESSPPYIEPRCLALLEQALGIPDASLVIYRDRTLVELKTDLLDGVHRSEEQGHVSWQIGAFDAHHCHLALGAVSRVLFSAEPVPCQGGGLNYTVWFLTAGPCGNPYRRDGYFSIVLNRPYSGDLPRLEVIRPVIDLYRRFRGETWIDADDMFLGVVADGPPGRTSSGRPRPGA